MAPAFSRRLFLGGLASLGIVATVKTSVFVPTLYGDMVHDDSPALNALFRGDPIRVLRGRVIEGERPAVVGARLLLRSPVSLMADGAVIADCSLTAAPDFEGGPMIRVGSTGVLISNIVVMDAPSSAVHFVSGHLPAPTMSFRPRANLGMEV